MCPRTHAYIAAGRARGKSDAEIRRALKRYTARELFCPARTAGDVIHTLMDAEADAVCGAEYGQRSVERSNRRDGYRHRQFDTRAGSLALAIPKLRHGWYFPDWLLERRKRAERALNTVVATCYLLGVSTRRMDKLVETLGITSLSKSQVSVMAK